MAVQTQQQKDREAEMHLFSKHKEDIKESASEAVKVIAEAASQAAKVVADAAAVSVKVLSIKNADDHDLLIKLNTLMDGLKEDIRDLKSGTSLKIEDHENRIKSVEIKTTNYTEERMKAIENKTSNYTITLSLLLLAVSGMISLILVHMFQK